MKLVNFSFWSSVISLKLCINKMNLFPNMDYVFNNFFSKPDLWQHTIASNSHYYIQ